MLEEVEMRFILTDMDGKILGCYTDLENAEMDARDLVGNKDEGYNLNIYELVGAQKIGEPFLQNTYEMRKSYPEPEEPESKEEKEGEEEPAKE